MNKKKLSVVMAGAMLATSVAPVLAAEVTAEDTKLSEKSLLAKKIVDLAKTKVISTNTTISGTGSDSKFVTDEVAALMIPGQTKGNEVSAYGIKVLDKNGKDIDLNSADIASMGTGTGNGFSIDTGKLDSTKTITYDIKTIETILTSDKLVEDMTVQVVERKTTEFLGQIIPGTQIEATGGTAKYSVEAFNDTNIANLGKDSTSSLSGFIKEVKANDSKTGATITLKALKNISNEKEGNVTIELDTTKNQLNFDLPLDANGKITDKIQECVGFAEVATYQKSAEITAAPEVKSAYKMVDDSAKAEEVTYLANELYDGLALTAKGTEIKADIENAKKVADENNRPKKPTVILMTKESANGVHSFKVAYLDSYKDVPSDPTTTNKAQTLKAASKIVTVKTTNEKELDALIDMLGNGKGYKVGIVAGANRYETAVNVAKNKSLPKVIDANADDADKNNIVLVNGESLVDGLAAAPLAAKLNMNNAKGTAVLLSKADSLPTATKEYLEELTSEIAVSKRKFVRINLVGGESVLSESLVEELKEMGFSVERFGGENREETSLEVARVVVDDAVDTNKLFVVGANGEADAMSIASVAVANETPIIVAKAGGLTKNAIRFIKANSEKAAAEDVAVIGGEKAVSKVEFDKIDESIENKIARVSGDNRFETNAAIIKKYASNISEVVLVKDGVANKKDLVDALSAANYAAGAPIVLATDKITESQKVAILDGKATGGFTKLTQVGQGVARTTLETVAEFLGLSNVK